MEPLSEPVSLIGKRVARVKIKSNGDGFHRLWKAQQHEIPNLAATNIQNCQTHEGEAGTAGCVLLWNYFLDGKDRVVKSQIIGIDEDQKSITYKVLEGDFLELYKTFVTNVRVEKDGSDNLVTWTVEYEKLSHDVPDPDTFMDFVINATKEIETYNLNI